MLINEQRCRPCRACCKMLLLVSLVLLWQGMRSCTWSALRRDLRTQIDHASSRARWLFYPCTERAAGCARGSLRLPARRRRVRPPRWTCDARRKRPRPRHIPVPRPSAALRKGAHEGQRGGTSHRSADALLSQLRRSPLTHEGWPMRDSNHPQKVTHLNYDMLVIAAAAVHICRVVRWIA
eukprot:2058102-Pleurochrysis_carterae.AAC.1